MKFEQGADMGGGKITNVGDGRIAPGSKDAINGGQLYEATQNLRSSMVDMDARTQQDIRNVGSRAAALAALHPLQYDKQRRTGFNIGYGNYRGDSSVALGLTHHFSKSAMLSASTTLGDNPMMNVGLAFRLGKADPEAERTSQIASAQNAKIAQMEFKHAQYRQQAEQYRLATDQKIEALLQQNEDFRQRLEQIEKTRAERPRSRKSKRR